MKTTVLRVFSFILCVMLLATTFSVIIPVSADSSNGMTFAAKTMYSCQDQISQVSTFGDVIKLPEYSRGNTSWNSIECQTQRGIIQNGFKLKLK